jgi:hypothetical protein
MEDVDVSKSDEKNYTIIRMEPKWNKLYFIKIFHAFF